MAKKSKITEGKTVLLPEPVAHIVSRELRLTPEQLAKMQAALDARLPLKMNVGLHSKLWAVGSGGTAKMSLAAEGEEDDDDIVDDDLEPPDDGTDIPEEEEEEPEPPEMFAKIAATSMIAPRGRKLVGATIKVYAVAVFRPEFKKTSRKTKARARV
jgi:hypothetical protein